MDWYLMVWKRFAEFEGRSRRKEYWMFALINIVVALILYVPGIILLASHNNLGGLLLIPYGLYCLATIVPGLAVSVRRLHDTGKSGWLLLLGLIPFVGGIIVLVLVCLDGDPGPNIYGPSPKAAGQTAAMA